MALIPEIKNTPKPFREDIKPRIEPPKTQSALIDTRELSDTKFTTYLDGQSWTVDFYKQVLGNNDVPQPPDYGNELGVYQTYRRIRRFELMVTSPLSSQQDTVTGGFTITGEANVYAVLKPSIGDAFIASTPNGQLGVFHITESERLSVYRQSAFRISYMQFGVINPATEAFFDKRVVEDLEFRKDYYLGGKYPFLTSEQVANVEWIRSSKLKLVDRMYRMFWSTKVQGLPVPDLRGVTVYDPWLHNAWLNFTGFNTDPRFRSYRFANLGNSQTDYVTTIWDSIIKGTPWNPDISVTRYKTVGVKDSKAGVYTFGLRYSGYNKVVVPHGLQFPFNQTWGESPTGTYPLDDVEDEDSSLPVDPDLNGDDDLILDESDNPPLVHPVDMDDYYMLSEAFYKGDEPNQSLLEREVTKLIHHKPIDMGVLRVLIEYVPSLRTKDAYYVIPLLCALIESYDRRY